MTLSHDEFADKLRAQSFSMWLERYYETSTTQGGDIITAEIAAPKWRADVVLAPMLRREAVLIQSIIEGLGPTGTFLLYDLRKAGPYFDKGGAGVAGRTVTIHTVGPDNVSLRLQGLPDGYQLRAGDMLSFGFGSNPSRRALHRVLTGMSANGDGVTPLIPLAPPLKAGTPAGATVQLWKPTMRMKMIQFSPGTSEGRFTSGMSFQAIEANR